MFNTTIIALATPPFPSALALIRVSGKDAFAITDNLFSKKTAICKEKTILYGPFKDTDGSLIDLVVVLVYPGPNTMTGEDVIEITCHGSPLIVNQIIQAYLSQGAVYATRGEFSSRAFYNGKMDLIEAEAVNDLINATTIESKNLALMSLSGKTSKLIGPLKEDIASLLALLEVGIDFPEYDEEESASNAGVASGCKKVREHLATLIKQGQEGQYIREGIKVAIVGEPNVGKSSILNALLKENKAIVSDIPGTTRDVVEGVISLDGIPLFLLDTAGIHDTDDYVERLGVERSKGSIEKADIVLFVHDASNLNEAEEAELRGLLKGKRVLDIYNKSDRVEKKQPNQIYVSALNNDIEPLKKAIKDTLGVGEDAYRLPSLSSARELALLRKIDQALGQAERDAEDGLTLDLLSVSLQEAYRYARELLGEEPTQDLEDEIFSRFCVGK